MIIARILAVSITTILAGLAFLHFYWAGGGTWGAAASIPELDGKPTLSPGPLACVVVALLLSTAAALVWACGWPGATTAARAGASGWGWLRRVGTAFVGLVLLARAVGDFRMIGFSKRVKGTRFAE